jgi:maltooligosyltrehalose trehalohydrolase
VHVRVWAPRRRTVSVVFENEKRQCELHAEADGYFAALIPDVRAGAAYRFRLDGDTQLFPDPASRFQPVGPHGPSVVVDPSAYRWRHASPRIADDAHVFYEMHIGTFTREGTYRAAAAELAWLAKTGITTLEVMPLNDFPGTFGWGYDGVNLWAPTRLYGEPDDLRGFVDAAHAAGLAVILDVVYNHLGPDGNHLKQFSESYFTDRYPNEWGESINFDGEESGPVREFFRDNAAYWIDEFHLDGLRLDATQSMVDHSGRHIVGEIISAARAAAAGRHIYVVVENEPQDTRMVDNYGANAMWNDDFHHAALVALTGKREAYYTDYLGNPQEFISAAKWGFLYQGQRYEWQKKPRGTDSRRIPRHKFIWYLANHDQVANSDRGARIHQLTSPGKLRAMTALQLLGPATPLLFQGQEFGATTPFLYFADHKPELAELVFKGRREFLSQFPSLAQSSLAAPHDRETFERCKLDWRERDQHREFVALHSDLLILRRSVVGDDLDGAVLSPHCFLLRYFEDHLLIVNIGSDLDLRPSPEPLLAPPSGRTWSLIWSSEAPQYGGRGIRPVVTEEDIRIPAEAAVVLQATQSHTASGGIATCD